MNESQNIEFKESWRDEYLKWICGFANAQGGMLYIGIKDNGEVCGMQDAKKLMEDIPNKVRDMLGILVEVNLKEKMGNNIWRLRQRHILILSVFVASITSGAVRPIRS